MTISHAAPRADYPVFKLHGITYVPHYKNPDAYVGPGYPRHTTNWFTESKLLELGAKATITSLFVRAPSTLKDWNA
jgi:hypothetical protein